MRHTIQIIEDGKPAFFAPDICEMPFERAGDDAVALINLRTYTRDVTSRLPFSSLLALSFFSSSRPVLPLPHLLLLLSSMLPNNKLAKAQFGIPLADEIWFASVLSRLHLFRRVILLFLFGVLPY
ncbi:hypothetical protein EW146_g7895 [Bondarzewia mesenterica]|uniref:Uncharacterized protein n=1 Tax=Bondarzewia mesenterica TaxID=1095465 RepID=A0A4S4LKE7_9AGAM|nr:hypothetical protein EW146_g7895 [Bondarzewia mesenterica]